MFDWAIMGEGWIVPRTNFKIEAKKFSFLCTFKGSLRQDFRLLLFFSQISFPHGPVYLIAGISKFCDNLQIYLNVKVNHRCQRHLQ
jgi:hypothetical protein